MIPGRTKREQVAPIPPSLISCTAKHQNALMVWRSLPTQPHTVTISKHSLWGYRRYGCRLLHRSRTSTQCWSKWKSLDHAWKGDYKGRSAWIVRLTKCGSGDPGDARNISWDLHRSRCISTRMEKKNYVYEISGFRRCVVEVYALWNVNQRGLIIGYRGIGPILKGQTGPPKKCGTSWGVWVNSRRFLSGGNQSGCWQPEEGRCYGQYGCFIRQCTKMTTAPARFRAPETYLFPLPSLGCLNLKVGAMLVLKRRLPQINLLCLRFQKNEDYKNSSRWRKTWFPVECSTNNNPYVDINFLLFVAGGDGIAW